MAEFQVEIVAVEHKVWSGEATMVVAKTTEGEIGVLPGHAPLLGQLETGSVVTVQTGSGSDVVIAAHGGFLSVTDAGVQVLADVAELAEDIDAERARRALDTARGGDDEVAAAAAARATARLRATGQSV